MSHLKSYRVFTFLLLLAVLLTITVSGQTTTNPSLNQKDSAAGTRFSTVEEMAKRVDSLQFIVVYNAELLRRDLDSKMMLIYVMLGIIIIASMLVYALLKQNQRQRKELEEKLFLQVSASVADLEAKIKHVEAGLPPPKPAVRKKKTK
jgi:uncharacterized membrane protein YeiB